MRVVGGVRNEERPGVQPAIPGPAELRRTPSVAARKGWSRLKPLPGPLPPPTAADSTIYRSAGDAKAAFESLKKLIGDWQGHVGTADGPEVNVTYRLTGAGSVVMETLDPRKPHEMVSMYYLDGKELVMTHYCAGGNQPHLRLNPATSSAAELTFDFTGGSNLNAAVDSHMHSGKLLLKDDDHIESAWTGYDKGKPSGEKRFLLARKKP